jgi:hypothetical protein
MSDLNITLNTETMNQDVDISFDFFGQINLIQNKEKIKQFIGKFLSTELGTSKTDENYGTSLSSVTGETIDEYSYGVIRQEIINSVAYAINKYNDTTNNEDEQIDSLDSIKFSTDADKSTKIHIDLKIIMKSGNSVDLGVNI